ncbi:MAG: DUF2442 domain-containing protein [Sulfuritalea sp.]|nr:DUF2442 domain-containing protein [Sulfuritalea sp.]
MLLDVIDVKTNADFSLDLLFDNGEWRRFDMKPLLAITPWSRIDGARDFRRARAEQGTVVWPGEIDVAPETLYDGSIPLANVKSDPTSIAREQT